MATIKGQNLRILLGPDTSHLKCVAAAQSCSLRVDAVAEDTSNKDVENDWMQKMITKLDWEVECQALVVLSDSGASCVGDLQVGETYVLRMSQTAGAAGHQNRDAVATGLQVTGEAILTDLTINAGNREEATYTAKFIGDGGLTPYTP